MLITDTTRRLLQQLLEECHEKDVPQYIAYHLRYVYMNKEKKICYIATPKNASSYFKTIFNKYRIQDWSLENKDQLKNYHVICTVRNPLDRFVSSYLEMFKGRVDIRLPKYILDKGVCLESLQDILDELKSDIFDIHFKQQVWFIQEYANYIDNIVNVDRMSTEIQYLSTEYKLDIPKHAKYIGDAEQKKKIKDMITDNCSMMDDIYDIYEHDYLLYNIFS
jgi:hypothetical protein